MDDTDSPLQTSSNASLFAAEADYDEARFTYLIERRDKLLERMQFGALAINAASLVAIENLKTGAPLNLTAPVLHTSATCFLSGIAVAGIAIWLDTNRARKEPADAYARMLNSRNLAALHKSDKAGENLDKVRSALNSRTELALVDFQFSWPSLIVGGFATGCWIVGICSVLYAMI